jgi:cyclopropane fatty-acyl-phospholipid synthase-like methyltransferase
LLPRLKLVAKKIFFPGLDLHTRCRYRFLSEFILTGNLETLDAGFGNGALSYAAFCKGNRVLGVTAIEREVTDTNALFDYLRVPRQRVELRRMNIYDLRSLSRTFDQIICSETLEHIKRDREVVQMFADLLNPGGRLLLCCPYALHPEHKLGRIDEPETGYHVRDGYTLESYRAILEPAGFRITRVIGVGSPWLTRLDRRLRGMRNRVGDFWAFPLFVLMLPLTWLDYTDPAVPFSLAVVAERS